MKVKDIMKKAASLLGNADDLVNYLNGIGNKGEKEAELLLNCFNFVENELALDYLPLVKKESYTPQAGKVFYSQFSSPAVRILGVENGFGEKIDYRVFSTYLEVDAAVVNIRYAYAPTEKTMSGESDYGLAVSARLLAFGMASEYLAALGLLEEASVWDKKYKEGIQAAVEWENKREADRKAVLEAQKKEEMEEEPDKEPEQEEPNHEEVVTPPSAVGTMPTRWWL